MNDFDIFMLAERFRTADFAHRLQVARENSAGNDNYSANELAADLDIPPVAAGLLWAFAAAAGLTDEATIAQSRWVQ